MVSVSSEVAERERVTEGIVLVPLPCLKNKLHSSSVALFGISEEPVEGDSPHGENEDLSLCPPGW